MALKVDFWRSQDNLGETLQLLFKLCIICSSWSWCLLAAHHNGATVLCQWVIVPLSSKAQNTFLNFTAYLTAKIIWTALIIRWIPHSCRCCEERTRELTAGPALSFGAAAWLHFLSQGPSSDCHYWFALKKHCAYQRFPAWSVNISWLLINPILVLLLRFNFCAA